MKAALKSVLVGLLVATALTGCAALHPTARPADERPSQITSPAHHRVEASNATDAERLQLLTTDPLFSGASTEPAAPATEEIANYDLTRGSAVSVVFGGDPNGTVSLATAHAQLERIQADGWKVVAVECQVNPAFSDATIYAIKRIGSFTAALTDEIAPGVVITAAIAPFHTEGSNPWKPNGKHTVAHTCIDGPGAPTTTTQSVDTNIGSKVQL